MNIGQKELLNYTTTRRKRLKNNLSVQRGALGLGGSKISNLRLSCSKIMLMILMYCNHVENGLCALNPLKYVIFLQEFTTNDLGKSSD